MTTCMSWHTLTPPVYTEPTLHHNTDVRTQVFHSEMDRMVIEMSPDGANVLNSWTFDHVFGVTSTTPQLYEAMVHPIVDKAMEGFNGTVFAYGQTASGALRPYLPLLLRRHNTSAHQTSLNLTTPHQTSPHLTTLHHTSPHLR